MILRNGELGNADRAGQNRVDGQAYIYPPTSVEIDMEVALLSFVIWLKTSILYLTTTTTTTLLSVCDENKPSVTVLSYSERQ